MRIHDALHAALAAHEPLHHDIRTDILTYPAFIQMIEQNPTGIHDVGVGFFFIPRTGTEDPMQYIVFFQVDCAANHTVILAGAVKIGSLARTIQRPAGVLYGADI